MVDEIEPELFGLRGARAGASPAGPIVGDLVSLSAVEEEHVRRVIARTSSLAEAASVLGIDQATLWRRRKQYGM